MANLLAQLKLHQRIEDDEKYSQQNATTELEKISLDELGSNECYPEILILLIDISWSMNGNRLSSVRDYISNRLTHSQEIVLYVVHSWCFQLTKCIPMSAFIEQNQNEALSSQHPIGLLKTVYYDTAVTCFKKDGHGVAEPVVSHTGLITRAKNKSCGVYDNSDETFSLYNFGCQPGAGTSIVRALTQLFVDMTDLISTHSKNVYFLFCTDADDVVTEQDIAKLRQSLSSVKALAEQEKNLYFESEIHIIRDCSGDAIENDASAMLKRLFPNTRETTDGTIKQSFAESAAVNKQEVKEYQTQIETFKPLAATYDESVEVFARVDKANEEVAQQNKASQVQLDQIASDTAQMQQTSAHLQGEFEGLEFVCRNVDSMGVEENDKAQEDIENLCVKYALLRDGITQQKQKIGAEKQRLEQNEKRTATNVNEAEAAVAKGNQLDKDIEYMKAAHYGSVNSNSRGTGENRKHWFRKKVAGLWQKVMVLFRAGAAKIAQAVSLGKEVKGLMRKLKKETEDTEHIERELTVKIEELEQMLQTLEETN